MYGRLLAWGLRQRRWRQALNALAIAVTVAVVMLFVSVVVELRAFANISADRELARILVWPKLQGPGGASGLPLALTPVFKDIPGVQVVQRHKVVGGRHESGATYIVSGEEESGIELNTDFFPVSPAAFEAWKQERIGAIVTEATAKELNLQVGQTVDLPTGQGPLQIKVVGLSPATVIAHRIAPHFEYMEEWSKNKGIASYRVFAKPGDFDRVAREIIERTKNTPTPAQPISDSEFTSSWVRRVGIVPALLGFLGLFLMFTTALTLANNSAIGIRERRTELATLRVLGYRPRTILGLILGEAVLVGIVGGLLAIVVTWLLLRTGVQMTPGSERLLQDVKLSNLGIIAGMITALLVPLAGALPAALAAVRMPLVNALRDTA